MTPAATQFQTTFDPDRLRRQNVTARLLRYLFENFRPAAKLLRGLCPILRFRGYALVTRYDDVREVLTNDAVFGVPYRPKIEELTGANFMLGMDDGPDYEANAKLAMQAYKLSDIPAQANAAAQEAGAIVGAAQRELDAMGGLVTPLLVGICERYYGVPVSDPSMFPLWAMAVSNYLFDAFPAAADAHAQARAGAERLCAAVDEAIAGGPAADTVLGRLLAAQAQANGVPDNQTIRTIIVSLVTAIVPTGTLAAGNMLEMLLRRGDMMTAAREATGTGDDELLSRCLFEALRFMPISPFWRRDAKRDFFLAPGKRLPEGTHVLASTYSAMFDARQVRQPNRFDPTRPASDYMLFGHGLHYCLGGAFASAVIPAILKPLLLCRIVARAPGPRGQRAFFAIFPERLFVTLQR